MFERNPDKSIDVTADGAVALVDDFATAGEQEEVSTPQCLISAVMET